MGAESEEKTHFLKVQGDKLLGLRSACPQVILSASLVSPTKYRIEFHYLHMTDVEKGIMKDRVFWVFFPPRLCSSVRGIATRDRVVESSP